MDETEQKLFLAIKNGNIQLVLQLLQSESLDINVRNEKKLTPLMLACQLKNRAAVEILVKQKNIDLSCCDGGVNNFSALMHYMVDNKSTEDATLVDILFDSNKLSQEDNNLALGYYASIGNLLKVKLCLEERKCDVNYQHPLFESALLKATKAKQIEIVKFLLSLSGVDVNCMDYLNRTPLHLAIENEFDELLELFLTKEDVDLHIQSYLLGTPLVAAIFLGQYDVALQLLDKEKEFKAVCHPRVMLCAIEEGATEVLEKLIKCGVDVNSTGEEGYKEPEDWVWQERSASPFDPFFDDVFELPVVVAVKMALEEQQTEALRILVAHGVDLDQVGMAGKSANQLLQENNTSIAKLLPINEVDSISKSDASPTHFFSPINTIPDSVDISGVLEDLLKKTEAYQDFLKQTSTVLSEQSPQDIKATLLIKDVSVLDNLLEEMKKRAKESFKSNVMPTKRRC